ncbi:MAG: hypothetical protein ACREE4_22090 [Stellaceae bacterium]
MPFFDFEWPVDQSGYEWTERPERSYVPTVLSSPRISSGIATVTRPADWIFRPRGGRLRYRRPLAVAPHLFREFAACSNREAIGRFIDEWGMLDGEEFGYLSGYLARARNLQIMLFALSETLGRNYAGPLLDYIGSPRFHASIKDYQTSPPEMFLSPVDLYNAMLWQLRQTATERVEIRQCKNCGNPIFVGEGHRDARTEFCGHRRVVAWGRRQRRADVTAKEHHVSEGL